MFTERVLEEGVNVAVFVPDVKANGSSKFPLTYPMLCNNTEAPFTAVLKEEFTLPMERAHTLLTKVAGDDDIIFGKLSWYERERLYSNGWPSHILPDSIMLSESGSTNW